MEQILNQINLPEDLKKLRTNEKEQLAEEIRKYVTEIVSKNGGHLASNLGVVELTMALHSVFNVPTDKIIWDVGHQTYIHKILTGRKEEMRNIRKQDGIAGFPKVSESEYDCFNTGHSSTSISAGLGMARARDIKRENHRVISIIGDGSLTGGMALEALNDAGSSDTNFIVILNDNEMSISENVGGISQFLNRFTTKKFYRRSNNYIKKVTLKIPYVGKHIVHFVRKIKYSLKQFMLPNMIFEDMGFKYLGPVDGHDLIKLESILKIARDLDGPVFIHCITKKGKGYLPAENNPDKFHAISSFDIQTGKTTKVKEKDYSKVFGDKLVELSKKNRKIVAVTAAMKDGTGLNEFARKYPNRFFDVGIAEQHAITMAAGLASQGLVPFVPMYSSFLQRGYDQVIHDICMQDLPVIICADRAGIVGNDGETHQGIYDLSFLNTIPNINILAPKDFLELEMMMEYAIKLQKPVVIRYPRGSQSKYLFRKHEQIQTGEIETLEDGTDLTIIAIGKMVAKAIQISDVLKREGINAKVINARFLKPIDEEALCFAMNKTKQVITIEDNSVEGGLGSTISNIITKYRLNEISLKKFGYPDTYVKHGSVDQIEEKYGLTVDSISKYCMNKIKKEQIV